MHPCLLPLLPQSNEKVKSRKGKGKKTYVIQRVQRLCQRRQIARQLDVRILRLKLLSEHALLWVLDGKPRHEARYEPKDFRVATEGVGLDALEVSEEDLSPVGEHLQGVSLGC
jgi:hypothetical protein